MARRSFRKSISVLMGAIGLISLVLDGFGADYFWVGPQFGGNWTDTNWSTTANSTGGLQTNPSGTGNGSRFESFYSAGGSHNGVLAIINGQSIGYLYFNERLKAGYTAQSTTVSFVPGVTLGTSLGTAVTNSDGTVLQTLNYSGDGNSFYGSVTSSNPTNVLFNLGVYGPDGARGSSTTGTSTWYSDGANPVLNASFNIGSGSTLAFNNPNAGAESITVNGPLSGAGGVSLSGTSSGPLTLVLADTTAGQAGAGYTGTLSIPTHTTLQGTTATIPGTGSGGVALSGGTLAFTDTSGTRTYGGPVTVSGSGNAIAATAGATSVTLGGGTTIQQGGTLPVLSNNKILFGSAGVGLLTINSGGTFDATAPSLAGGNQTISVGGGLLPSSGAIIKVAIDGVSHSTIIDLGGTNGFNLNSIILDIISTASPSPQTEYTLFTNVAAGTMTGTPSAINLINFPNFVAVLGDVTGSTIKFTLALAGISNGQTAASATNSVARLAQTTTQIARGVLAAAREGDNGKPSYGASSFTSHPLRAPDLTTDFLNATQGGLANAAQETTQRWSPARTDRAGIWFQPFGIVNRQVANGGSPGSKTRTAGLLAGFDYKSRYDFIWGAALGYARTREDFDSNAGKTKVKDRFLKLFSTWFRGPWYVEGSLLMGLEKYQGTRNTGLTNNNLFVSNNHNGYQISPNLGGGYTFEIKGSRLKTYATFDYTYAIQYGYQEQGFGGNYFKQMDASMLRSEAGANISKIYEYDGFSWKPGFTLSVVNKKPLKKGIIVAASGASFESTTTTTTNISPGLESTLTFEDGYSFGASWIGEFGSQYNMQEAFLKFSKKL